ncbi:MAG: YfhO family protein [Gemmatimonadota bacterium]|nr:YfhO family protein [Gemmatimonadota bacterium]
MANAPRSTSSTYSEGEAEPFGWLTTGRAAAVYFALSLLYFLPTFLPGRHIFGTDYLAGGYFFYNFISERLAAGELPKWVPYVFGGMPLAANPGSTYHPVHFLSDMVLSTRRVLPFVFMFHFGAAGVGMYLLAGELGCRRWVAFIAGLAFQFTGITMSWVYAGHDGRIMVATVAPLFFFFLHRGIRTATLPAFAGAAATLGFALLSFQIQNAYYLLVAAVIWAVFCLFHLGVVRHPARLAKTVLLGLGAVAFAFALAAVDFLPFLDYIPESPRGQEGGRGYEYSTSYSMPIAELLSIAVPEQAGASVADPIDGRPLFPPYQGQNGFKLHTEYAGTFVVVLLALGFAISRRDRYWWFFGGLALFFLSIALGGNTPLYRLYYEILPGTKRFRAPSLSFFVVAMALVTMAALTLERLAALWEGVRTTRGRAGAESERISAVTAWVTGGIVGLSLLGAAMSGGDAAMSGAPSAAQGWMRFAFFAAAVGAILWAWMQRRMAAGLAAVALATVTLADLWIIDRRFLHTVDEPEVTFAPDDVISFLQSQPQPARVWNFPFPQPYRSGGPYGGNYPMLYGIEQAGGEHPNPLQRWNQYLGAGTQTYIDWHNWITEAGIVDTSEGQAIAFRSSPGFLDGANVRFVISMAPLSHPALREVHRGSALVYENTRSLPRAYLVPEALPSAPGGSLARMQSMEWDPRRVAFVEGNIPRLPSTQLTGGAEVLEHTPDRVRVRTRANRTALLVLADNFYRGWEATVDGRRAEIFRTNHTFRGVVVPAGEHEVRFEFRPAELRSGFVIYLAGFGVLALYGVWLLAAGRRRPRPAP